MIKYCPKWGWVNGQYDWNNTLNSSPLADHQNGQGHGRRNVKICPANPIAWSLNKPETKLGWIWKGLSHYCFIEHWKSLHGLRNAFVCAWRTLKPISYVETASVLPTRMTQRVEWGVENLVRMLYHNMGWKLPFWRFNPSSTRAKRRWETSLAPVSCPHRLSCPAEAGLPPQSYHPLPRVQRLLP